MIPYGKQSLSEDDIQAVVDVLRSDFITQGPQVPAFEKALAEYCGAQHGVAVNSATSALHIACKALGLGEGDILWTTPISFVASANCGLYCGADVDFVDIDPQTYNLCPKALEEKLKVAKQENRLPKVVVPVHLSGQSCDMQAIHQLSKEYGFNIIEDASHAIGGRYQNKPIGNGEYSDITVFSFHPVKIITSAEGGMAITNSAELAEKMALLRSHGITRDEKLMTQPADGDWYYQQVELGYNYRMTELQGALGLSQLTRLDEFVARRHKIVDVYNQQLKDLPITLPYQLPETYSAYHLYIIRLTLDGLTVSHKEVFHGLRRAGIGVNLHYIPIHSQPYYKNLGFELGDFPESEKYYSQAISLPLYPELTPDDQQKVIDTLKGLLK
ncbi:MAG: UDP-4-amino-4,6-dideoxy-N-acetyl-beta-L-altrosamine transaminase [Cellvibrionaceae bacterium]